ncbi:major facilitator transporter [Lactobacillus delbrueckii subsp. delbrueckii DSM 20074 = JCM 1012]|nr:major facilitator transporter [Lactobacillus delbrueckii subsp. delbrueckii DSM 20074 = JCM 1012]
MEIFWLVTFFAEIPSGYSADKFGYLKTIMASGIIRALGLIILALSPMNLLWMTVSRVLTALGDSLQSGTMTSWIANKAVEHGEKDQLGAIFFGYSLIGTPLTMAATFVGANILGNIRLDLPLLIGAAFLLATSLTIIPLLKYDSQNLAEEEEGMPKLNLVADVKYTVKQEQKTFAWILLLLPVAIISAGPLDQWQMYFQRGKAVNSGTISVLMSLAGMLAISLYNRYVSKKPLSNKRQTRLIVVSTVMMAATFARRGWSEKLVLWVSRLVHAPYHVWQLGKHAGRDCFANDDSNREPPGDDYVCCQCLGRGRGSRDFGN